jgi:mRNA interferase RelE/StbE
MNFFMLRLIISKKAQKFLSKLPPKQQNQVAVKIKELKKNGHGVNSIHLKGSAWYRVDVGEYRIIYDIENKNELLITLVGKRNDDEVYKKLRRLE